jgi:hypothetical protein
MGKVGREEEEKRKVVVADKADFGGGTHTRGEPALASEFHSPPRRRICVTICLCVICVIEKR